MNIKRTNELIERNDRKRNDKELLFDTKKYNTPNEKFHYKISNCNISDVPIITVLILNKYFQKNPR